MIYTVVRYVVILGIILAVAFFYKNSAKVTIATQDQSMQPSEMDPGNYSIDDRVLEMKQLQQGDLVAYYSPGLRTDQRVGRVVATEGQRVEVTEKEVKVNGVATMFKVDDPKMLVAEVRVPRGCVFVMADRSSLGNDSLRAGPIPLSNLMGKVKK